MATRALDGYLKTMTCTRSWLLTLLCLLSSFAAFGCSDDDDGGDAGDASADAIVDSTSDADDTGADGAETDANADGSDDDADLPMTDGCTRLSVGTVRYLGTTDVDISFQVDLMPDYEGGVAKLDIVFQSVGGATYMGEYDLSMEPPRGLSSEFCAHCFTSTLGPSTYVAADRGTLVQSQSPWELALDISVTDLRLVEWEAEEGVVSVKEDGTCIEIEDFQINEQFLRDGWTCPASDFNDGEFCQCACGTFDPDCAQGRECTPETPCDEPPEAIDCNEGTFCTSRPVIGAPFLMSEPFCAERCDWEGREGCEAGVCVGKRNLSEDECITQPERISDADLGAPCTGDDMGLARYCGVDEEGFAMGYCNDLFPSVPCTPLCTTQGDCTVSGESCIFFIGDAGIGFCSAPAPDDG